MGCNGGKENKVGAKWVTKWLKYAKKANEFGQKDHMRVKRAHKRGTKLVIRGFRLKKGLNMG